VAALQLAGLVELKDALPPVPALGLLVVLVLLLLLALLVRVRVKFGEVKVAAENLLGFLEGTVSPRRKSVGKGR